MSQQNNNLAYPISHLVPTINFVTLLHPIGAHMIFFVVVLHSLQPNQMSLRFFTRIMIWRIQCPIWGQ